jgi:flagellar protein FlaG
MGQVSTTALRAAPPPDSHANAAKQTERAHAQAVASAVQTINQAGGAGAGREVTFSTDSTTKELVIQVVDKQSGEVVVQWPSKYALEMAQDYKKEHPGK